MNSFKPFALIDELVVRRLSGTVFAAQAEGSRTHTKPGLEAHGCNSCARVARGEGEIGEPPDLQSTSAVYTEMKHKETLSHTRNNT